MVFKIRVGRSGFFFFNLQVCSFLQNHTNLFLSFLLQLINYLTCVLVQNIDQMYNEMKKIVEVRNKHGNGDEFPDFADLFFFGIKNVRVGRSIGNTPIVLDMMNKIMYSDY